MSTILFVGVFIFAPVVMKIVIDITDMEDKPEYPQWKNLDSMALMYILLVVYGFWIGAFMMRME